MRKVPPHFADLGFHQVEVVEQPLRRRGDRLAAAHVLGQGLVGAAQDAGIVMQPREEAMRAAPRTARQRVGRREHPGALLEVLDAQQLAPKGTGRRAGGLAARI